MKKPSLRRIALNALMDITDNGAYANLAIKNALGDIGGKDAAWINALVYNTLDNLIYIDKVIEKNTKSKTDKKIKAILRLGVCQVLFMNTPVSAAVNESVKLTKEIGKSALAGYVNAVMRAVATKKDVPLELPEDDRSRISLQYSYPKPLVDMFVDDYGVEFTEQMLKCRHNGMNFRLVKPFDLKQIQSGENFKPTIYENAVKCENGFDVTNNELFLSGKITVQSLSSMTVCHVLQPQCNTKILDACAAPGGKTAYISELMGNSGKIVAGEWHEHRIELIKNTLKRLNAGNVDCVLMDAKKPHAEFFDAFDAVLTDVPCSGLGVIGKSDIKHTKTVEDIENLSKSQYEILSNCSKYVKVGGALVYSTCTVTKLENELNALKFLKEHPNFKADTSIAQYLPDTLKNRTENGMIQIFPHLDDMEGFFIARFIRWT